jgi:hypothetical protein
MIQVHATVTHEGRQHMKKIISILFLGLLLADAAKAQGTDLYELSSRTLDMTEAVAVCAGQDAACSRDDIQAMRDELPNIGQDLFGGLTSGRLPRLTLTLEEGEALLARVEGLQSRFVHISLLDARCNRGARFATAVLRSFERVLKNWGPALKSIFQSLLPFYVTVLLAGLYSLGVSIWILILMLLLVLDVPTLLNCLWWWL